VLHIFKPSKVVLYVICRQIKTFPSTALRTGMPEVYEKREVGLSAKIVVEFIGAGLFDLRLPIAN